MKVQDRPESLPEPQNTKQNTLTDVFFLVVLLSLGIILPFALNKFGPLTVLGVFGGILSFGIFLQPEIGVLAYLFITYTQLSNTAISEYNLPSIIQLLAGLMSFVIIVRMVLYSERPLSGIRIIQIMIIYVLTWLIPLLTTNDFDIVSEALIFNAKRVLGGIIIIYFIRRPEIIRRSIWAIIIAGILMGTVSVFQNTTATYDNNYWGFGRWLLAEDSNLYSRYRLTGPYGDPNPYAQIMVVVVVLAFERFLHEKKRSLRVFAVWALFVCVLTIFFTYSRGSGFLNLIFTMGVFVYFSRQRFVIPAIFVLIFGLLVAQFLPSTYLVRIFTLSELLPSSTGQITDPSFRHRLNENTASWKMFLDHPFVGVGIGNFPNSYVEYGAEGGYSASSGPVAAPSLYAEIISEQGLLGTVVFMFIMYYMFRDLLRAKRIFEDIGRNDLAMMSAAFFAAMAGYMFSGLFKQSAYSNVFWVLFGVAVGIHQVAVELHFTAEKKSIVLNKPALK